MVIYAGVEGGGTTWRVALAEGHPSNIVESKSFVTLDDAKQQLKEIKDWLSIRKYDCLGIGTFGPIDPREVRVLVRLCGFTTYCLFCSCGGTAVVCATEWLLCWSKFLKVLELCVMSCCMQAVCTLSSHRHAHTYPI